MLVILGVAVAAEVQPGQIHQGGEELTSSAHGVSLTVPAGQMATIGEGSVAIGSLVSALGSTVTLSADDLGAIRAGLAEPRQTDGIAWTPSEIRREGGHLVVDLTGTALLGGPRIGRLEVIPGGHGWTALVQTSGKPKHREGLDALHRAIVGSLRFTAPSSPPVPAAAAVPPRQGPWIQALSGRQLRRITFSSVHDSEQRLTLCADGRALYWSERVMAGGDPYTQTGAWVSASNNQEAEGRWGVQGDTLVAANAEDRAEWTLSRDSQGRVLLDGERWTEHDPGGQCR